MCAAAAEIVSDAGKTVNNSFASDGFINGKAANSLEESGSGRNEPKSDGNGRHQNLIRMRLRQLESELTSALHLLRSGNGGGYSSQVINLCGSHTFIHSPPPQIFKFQVSVSRLSAICFGYSLLFT